MQVLASPAHIIHNFSPEIFGSTFVFRSLFGLSEDFLKNWLFCKTRIPQKLVKMKPLPFPVDFMRKFGQIFNSFLLEHLKNL